MRYKAGLKRSYRLMDNDAMVEFDQMWLVFNKVAPAVHTLLPSVLQHLDSCDQYRSSHPDPQKNPELYNLIIGPILLCSQVFFHVGEQKIVKWCHIRRIWRVINQFKATVMHSSHCNHRLVYRSIVLVK